MTPAERVHVRPSVLMQIVAPLDPEAMPIGGIAAFVRGFVKYAPSEFEFELVGTSRGRPLGAWRATALEGRAIRHLPVARSGSRSGPVPLAATFTLGLLRHRARIPALGVRQFHRPATALPLLRGPAPCTGVIHLRAKDLTHDRSESRWRHAPLALRVVEWLTIRALDRVYVVNEIAAAEYRRTYRTRADRIAFVPNWVDDETFVSADPATRAGTRRELRAEVGLPGDSRVLLSAGRLERQKDPILALQAATGVMQRRPEVVLVFAGQGRLRREVDDEARRLGVADRVRFLGAIERTALARWMTAADALLIASVVETGPTVALEALATGLPVATTEVGTIAPIVAAQGCGNVATGHSAAELGVAIERVLDSDGELIRATCLQAVTPYRARVVLPRLYDDARRLTTRTDEGVSHAKP